MEDLLDLYQEIHDSRRPQVCLDEQPQQLTEELVTPLAEKGKPRRIDYTYKRNGVCNIFMMFAPAAGWRHVKVTDHRKKTDYAHCIKELVDVHFPEAEKIRLVEDNLNTHTPAALYETFPPAEARRILRKLEFHRTPKHASWLNMAETELSVLTRQCLGRRIPDKEQVKRAIEPWQKERNDKKVRVKWQFTVEKARKKFSRFYSANSD